jgi:hypothetical protein
MWHDFSAGAVPYFFNSLVPLSDDLCPTCQKYLNLLNLIVPPQHHHNCFPQAILGLMSYFSLGRTLSLCSGKEINYGKGWGLTGVRGPGALNTPRSAIKLPGYDSLFLGSWFAHLWNRMCAVAKPIRSQESVVSDLKSFCSGAWVAYLPSMRTDLGLSHSTTRRKRFLLWKGGILGWWIRPLALKSDIPMDTSHHFPLIACGPWPVI